ncbi:MAPEG family protein [Bdellovibrio sp. SKB1291214]|uniref:MAPEG family protein n=1 Tax=Bdellovibrio sp. SKB1291214 TaxID=1732569 RepID=UPI001C3D0ED7|nr:MAPEG family protein [Bdellovibrio sp. SKB1291214]UYL09321.1 MAPEG family protein [Bdellovibrio sp. SKB1291214]
MTSNKDIEMRLELIMLAWSTVLGLFYLIVSAQAATKVRGIKWNLSARDEGPQELKGVPGRLQRAFKNFLETYAFFVAATLLVHITDRYSVITAIGSALYFWGRVVYLPLYAFGIPYARTAVWGLSTTGIVLMLIALGL